MKYKFILYVLYHFIWSIYSRLFEPCWFIVEIYVLQIKQSKHQSISAVFFSVHDLNKVKYHFIIDTSYFYLLGLMTFILFKIYVEIKKKKTINFHYYIVIPI